MMEVINNSRYWFLYSINYKNKILEIIIVEGIIGDLEYDEGLTKLSHGEKVFTHPVEVTEKSKVIKITFENVMTFHVRDETFEHNDNMTIPQKGNIRIHKISKFLNESGSTYYERMHYEIITEDNVIHVLTEKSPTIEKIKSI